MDVKVKSELKKLCSLQLCPSVTGQVYMDALVNPPQPKDASYNLFMEVCFCNLKKKHRFIFLPHFIKEKNGILGNLREKAKFVTESLNKIDGIKCNSVQG